MNFPAALTEWVAVHPLARCEAFVRRPADRACVT